MTPNSPNTTETFAVGGPAVRYAEAFDVNLAPNGKISGPNRYDTAVLAAQTFTNPTQFAVADGLTNFTDALVAGGYIANLDGPLLLSNPDSLSPATAVYLNASVGDGDRVFTFGGPYSLKASVTQQIVDLLELKFALDPETL